MMLGLSSLYEDSIDALDRHGSYLEVRSLPPAVFMMQRDVINHYRYALEHYFTISLSEPYLQNSSHGSPYQKWAFFVNENWGMLSYTVHQLLRYTSRLIHETELKMLLATGRASEMKGISNDYTDPLCDFRHNEKKLGIHVSQDHSLTVTPLRRSRSAANQSEHEIRDRSVLAKLKADGLAEVDSLVTLNRRFAAVCNQYCEAGEIAEDFDNLIEAYWT
jgi:hypothetical protein